MTLVWAQRLLGSLCVQKNGLDILMKPVFSVLLHDQHNDSFKKVLFGILKEVGGVDPAAFKRPGCDQRLWEEIANVRTKRNEVIHKASPVSTVDAERSIEIASTVLEVLLPKVIAALQLKTDANLRIVVK